MDYRTIASFSSDDSRELQRHEDRLRKRLQRFGYHLSKGITILPTRKIPLKREPTKRGYQISKVSTGEVELGERHDLTLGQVEEFWQRKNNEWWAEKQKARTERQKARLETVGNNLFSWQ